MTQTLKLHLCLHLYEFALCYCYLNELLVFSDSVDGVHVCSIQTENYALEPMFISSAVQLPCFLVMSPC